MKKWMILISSLFIGTTSFANCTQVTESCLMHDGFFLGLGADYNTLKLTQNSWGEGITNVQTSTGDNSNGIAEGIGAPFHNNTNTFAPGIQVGYFKHFLCENLFGFKFSYQYLDTFVTNPNLYIPQLGTITSSTGTTSPLFGYVNANSVQVSTNHAMNLLAFIGQSCGNKYFYLGVGPAVYRLQARNYNAIGYAEVDGVTVNVTGLVNYSSPPVWLWGGAVQLGMTYFISPTWFLDVSYTYTKTGNKTLPHQQAFANASTLGSVNYTTSGTIITKNTVCLNNQSLRLSINKVFDF